MRMVKTYIVLHPLGPRRGCPYLYIFDWSEQVLISVTTHHYPVHIYSSTSVARRCNNNMMASSYFTYISYFYPPYTSSKDAIVICVSDEAWKCRYYSEKIRQLDRREYEIREILLNESSRYSLFEDYILEEFDENYNLLTNQDIYYLTKEVDEMIDRWQALSEEMKAYRLLLKKLGSSMSSSIANFSKAIINLDEHLSSVGMIRRLCREMYKESPVLSPNIYEYLQHMKMLQYDKELNDMYTMKVNDDQ